MRSREKTKRTNGHDLLFTCSRLSRQLRGWFTYFRHCRGSVFRQLDGWIRGRLRSMLRGGRNGVEGDAERTTNVGPIASSTNTGCSPCKPPIFVLYNPHGGNTINWRAGCGKSASPVRREGGPGATGSPYPYPKVPCCFAVIINHCLPADQQPTSWAIQPSIIGVNLRLPGSFLAGDGFKNILFVC